MHPLLARVSVPHASAAPLYAARGAVDKTATARCRPSAGRKAAGLRGWERPPKAAKAACQAVACCLVGKKCAAPVRVTKSSVCAEPPRRACPDRASEQGRPGAPRGRLVIHVKAGAAGIAARPRRRATASKVRHSLIILLGRCPPRNNASISAFVPCSADTVAYTLGQQPASSQSSFVQGRAFAC